MSKPSTYAPHSISTVSCSSTTVGSIALTLPCSAILLSSQVSDVVVTFDGTTPTVGSATTTTSSNLGHLIPHNQLPALFLVGSGHTVSAINTVAGNAFIQVTTLQ